MDAVTQPKVFISYAHADGQSKINEFWTALRAYLNEAGRSWDKWDDKEILVGQEWDKTIEQALENGCNCCLLMISDLFCNSSYIIDKEWPKTLSRYEEQGIVFFPVVFGVLERGLVGLPDKMGQFQVYWPTVAELYVTPQRTISNPDQVHLCYIDAKDNDAARDRFLSRLAKQMNDRFEQFLRNQATKSQRLEKEQKRAEAERKAEEERNRKQAEEKAERARKAQVERKTEQPATEPKEPILAEVPKDKNKISEPGTPKPSETSPLKKFTNSIGMEFVLIPAETFVMGSRISPEELVQRYGGAEKWYECEKQHHAVKIERPFYLQTTPVTQGQWQRLTGENPSNFKGCGDDCPVDLVSWIDVQMFIEELNQIEKTKDYRLPSEAEWEYACRAGSEAEFSFGSYAKRLGEFAWYSGNSDMKTHPVGKKKPNDWGLYDMHGNVWEWVEDDWHGSYDGAPVDGRAWVDNPRGSLRVVRGGSWRDDARDCRSATRYDGPDDRVIFVGFRLSRSVALGP